MRDFGPRDIAVGAAHAVHVSDELRAIHVIDLAGLELVGPRGAQHRELAARTVRHALQPERADRAELGKDAREIDRTPDARGQRIKKAHRVVVFRLCGDDGSAYLAIGQNATEIALTCTCQTECCPHSTTRIPRLAPSATESTGRGSCPARIWASQHPGHHDGAEAVTHQVNLRMAAGGRASADFLRKSCMPPSPMVRARFFMVQ